MLKVKFIEVPESKFLEILKASKNSLEEITMENEKAENDNLFSCELKGSYRLLVYRLENIEKINHTYQYILNENKAYYKCSLPISKDSITKEHLAESFKDLKEHIDNINSYINKIKTSE